MDFETCARSRRARGGSNSWTYPPCITAGPILARASRILCPRLAGLAIDNFSCFYRAYISIAALSSRAPL
eukprot:2214739-Pyramimonas_sp.AAC.1